MNINEQMKQLLQEWKQCENEKERNKTFEKIKGACAPLTSTIIGKMSFMKPITDEELKQEADVVLFEVITKYEDIGKIKFSNYYMTALEFKLIHYIRTNSYIVKVPRSIIDKNVKIKKQIKNYEDENGMSPNVEKLQIDGITDEDKSNFCMLKNMGYDDLSELYDYAANEDDVEIKIQMAEVMEKAKDILKEKELEVLKMLIEYDFHYSKIATKLGCSRAAISYSAKRIIEKLKNELA